MSSTATATPAKYLRFLITGGSRGIGLACAHRFASQGHHIILLARNNAALSTATSELPRTHSEQNHECIIGDVSQQETWEKVKAEHKKLDVLISAAGISQTSLLSRTKPDAINSIISTNLTGTILGSRTVSSLLLHRRSPGVIVNISSVLGLSKCIPGTSVYAASKAGVIGFSRALAVEVGSRGIRVNTVCPGYVKTQMTEDVRIREIGGDGPMGRWAEMDEVVNAVEFVVNNGYVNGAEVVVDGGLRLS
ncbi:NAD(P)-binding protein [Ascodesmis nigricans]|uniref:NAD(P)-binding protein n=1 Tax=Ascodesmis nigricans TaxID=341454 RepID=A0A4S2N8H1_9PEZI|nr:NAD(P)-binding protein [Ascodesmis nigricans]